MTSALSSSIAVLALGALGGAALSDVPRLPEGGVHVSVEDSPRGQMCTIRARKAPVEKVLAKVAEALDLELAGFESTARAALVDAELERRPLYYAIETVLGSVGLRAELRPGVLAVVEDELGDDVGALLDHALALYASAAQLYPGHPSNASAHLVRGEIEEERGNVEVALEHYEAVVQNFRASALVPDALMHAGSVLEEMEIWEEAAARYQSVASRSDASRLTSPARLGLARCAIEQGEHARALQLVALLDASNPPADDAEEAERLLVRARALCLASMHQTALLLLDRAERIGLDDASRRTALELRARALEGVGLPGEAARAWLIWAHEADDAKRMEALGEAARLALEDGDEIGVLFVQEEAARAGVSDERLADFAREARLRLGLDVRTETEGSSVDSRLAAADRFLRSGRAAEAIGLLEPLFRERTGLDEESRTRVVTAFAAGIEATRGLDSAIALLGAERPAVERLENRRQLDRSAAELFERHGRFDEAVEAYRGRY